MITQSHLAAVLANIESATSSASPLPGDDQTLANSYVNLFLPSMGWLRLKEKWENDEELPTASQLRAIVEWIVGRTPYEGKEGELFWLQKDILHVINLPAEEVTPLYKKCGGYKTLRHYMVKTELDKLRESIKDLGPQIQEEVYRLATEMVTSFKKFA